MMRRAGFSLVELSIVLVILGLLVGGILAGQSLIRASELRAVITESQRYQTALHAFRDKYFAMPGDMGNAISVWGRNTTTCSSQSGTAGTPGTCNGDSDSMVDYNGTAGVSGENWQVWTQLALAGMIEGSYSGAAGTSPASQPGNNMPRSELANASWSVSYADYSPAGDTWNFAINMRNRLMVHEHPTGGGLMTTTEVWNIDTKADDGRPGSGKVINVLRNLCTNSSSATDFAATYTLSTTTANICSLAWRDVI